MKPIRSVPWVITFERGTEEVVLMVLEDEEGLVVVAEEDGYGFSMSKSPLTSCRSGAMVRR